MATDNETPEGGQKSLLSEDVTTHMTMDEDKLDAVLESFEPRKETAERDSWYKEREETFGPTEVERMVDRSKPVGVGEGFRQGTDFRDAQSRRMFALDQSMGADEAFSPSMDSTTAAYFSTEYLNHAIQQTQELDPDYAMQLAMADRFLAMYPELAVTTRNGFGYAGITEQMGAELQGLNVQEWNELADESLVYDTDIADRVFAQFGNQMDPNTKKILMVSVSPE